MKNKMDPSDLKPGDRVETVEGSVAQVIETSEDGVWIRVRYVASARNPKIIGTEDLCSVEDLRAFST